MNFDRLRHILKHLHDALKSARLTDCAVNPAAQKAMRLYLQTWVVGSLEAAIEEMKGERPR